MQGPSNLGTIAASVIIVFEEITFSIVLVTKVQLGAVVSCFILWYHGWNDARQWLGRERGLHHPVHSGPVDQYRLGD